MGVLTTEFLTNVGTAIICVFGAFVVGVIIGRLVQHRYETQSRRKTTDGQVLRLGTARQPSEGGRVIRRVPNHPNAD